MWKKDSLVQRTVFGGLVLFLPLDKDRLETNDRSMAVVVCVVVALSGRKIREAGLCTEK
jgi:hypothetical protein